MLKKLLFWFVISCFSGLHAQDINSLYKTKKVKTTQDTIYIEKESINSSFFKLLDQNGIPIDTSFYKVNFKKGTLLLKENNFFNSDSLTLQYLKFPQFLTKEYRIYDPSRVVSNEAGKGELYKIEDKSNKKNAFECDIKYWNDLCR